MSTLFQDIRYAIRTLAKSPGFTIIAIVTLALGIGANTAIFSVVNSTVLAPLPFKNSSQLVDVHAHATFFDFWNLGLSLPDINDLRAQSKSFSYVLPFQYATVDLTGSGSPRELFATKIPSDYFAMLGIKPLYGRAFLPSEMQPGADHEAILSYAMWRDEFGSNPNIVGKNITLDEALHAIVGVMPPMPQLPLSPGFADLWVPFAPSPAQMTTRGMHAIPTMARLKPGVTVREAQAELDGIAARLAKAYPEADKNWSFRVNPMRSDMNRLTKTPLLILLGAVGFVLLIACANVGNLFLSRGWARRRELAIRSTLGATRPRLIRQLLVESTLLALVGGACGMLLAWWGISSLKLEAIGAGVSSATGIAMDQRVLLFTFLVSLLAGLLFGLAPAFLSSRQNLASAVKEGGPGAQTGASSGGHNPLRQLLAVSEIALALVLVIGATLALRSFSRMLRINFGFDVEHVLDMRLEFPSVKFKNSDAMFSYVRTLTDRLRATPGVEYAATAGNGPISSAHGEGNFEIEGVPDNPKSQLSAETVTIGPGYFEALGIPLLRGREFRDADTGKAAQTMIVNRAFAQKFFAGQNPIGKRIFMGDEDAQHNKIWDEVVGEVADVHDRSPQIPAGPTLYIPFYDAGFTSGMLTGADFLLRTRVNPAAMISAAQNQVWAFDKNEPVSSIQTMQQRVEVSVASPRFQSFLLGGFGALGLLLAIIGIYGVISYAVTQRTHEIGIRMALGAEPLQVMRLILAHGLKLAIIGVVIGLATAFGLTRLMSSLLFGISATDPLTFAGVALLLLVVALVACYIPARRAMKVDPMVALRYE
ncbi:MAG TPA: ABC transporter permease [Candidatus Acidoferrales bacterium]|nr:ABC transporter permease [Candidatus Acidoferrales bacterium]